jgi:hypothetical protein
LIGALAIGAVAEAGTVSATIQGNTVTFSAQGLPVESQVTVRLATTSGSVTVGRFSIGPTGTLPLTSASPGVIPNCSTVIVDVLSVPAGNSLASTSADQECPTEWLDRVVSILLRIFS